jgi:hypothetical protein
MAANLVDASFIGPINNIIEAVTSLSQLSKEFSLYRDASQLYNIPEISAEYLYKDVHGDIYIKGSFLEMWEPHKRSLMVISMIIHCAMCDLVLPRGQLLPGVQVILGNQNGIWISAKRKLNGTFNYMLFNKRGKPFQILAYSDGSGVMELLRGEPNEPVEPEPEPEVLDEMEVKGYVKPSVFEQDSFFSELRYLNTSEKLAKMQRCIFTLAERRSDVHFFSDTLIRSEWLNVDGSAFNPIYLETLKGPHHLELLEIALRIHKFFREYGYSEEMTVAPEFWQLVKEYKYEMVVEPVDIGNGRENFVKILTGNGWVYVKTAAVVSGKGYLQKERYHVEDVIDIMPEQLRPQRVYRTRR